MGDLVKKCDLVKLATENPIADEISLSWKVQLKRRLDVSLLLFLKWPILIDL